MLMTIFPEKSQIFYNPEHSVSFNSNHNLPRVTGSEPVATLKWTVDTIQCFENRSMQVSSKCFLSAKSQWSYKFYINSENFIGKIRPGSNRRLDFFFL